MDQKRFYKRVYMTLAIAVLVFLCVEYLFLNSETIITMMLSMLEWYRRLLLLIGFSGVSYLTEKMAINSTDKKIQYLAFFLYIIAEALLFVPLLIIALAYSDIYMLIQAGIATFMLFGWLSVVAFTTKKDFSFLRSSLIIGTFIAMWLIVGWILVGFNLGLLFSGAMILLAGWSILYQTSNIIHKYNKEQYVVAAMGLFASLMLMLWYVIRIFSRK